MTTKDALVVLYPGCVELEIILLIQELVASRRVVAVTPDGRPVRGASGMMIGADAAYGDVEGANYAWVVVPGGDPGSVLHDTSLDRALQQAHAGGATMAAVCAGPLLLAKAGLLVGRRFTHGFRIPEDLTDVGPYFDGAHSVDEPVVVDGPIVTAKANAFVAFAFAALRAGNACTAEYASRRLRFFQG